MSSHLWFFYSMGASILWGLGYVLSEKVLKTGITPAVYLFVVSILGTICYGLVTLLEGWRGSYDVLLVERRNILLLFITAFIFVVANILISYSVLAKNATMASFIEISYPVFTAFFAWLIFREVQFNFASLIGGLLIFSGVAFIFFGSK